MVSHPCLFVFAVFGLRSIIADELKCKTLFDSRNAVLDCHIQCEGPTVITFLKWTKSQSILALWKGNNYTHMNRFGFRQPWNPNSQDFSLQINNFTKEDSGEYIYTVFSTCETLMGSVHLEIPGKVKCKTLVDSRNAVLDCHLQCEGPNVIVFLMWTKNQSTLALYKRSSYTHMNRFGFRQPWNPSSQDISLQINNPTKEDSGEYIYSVISECEVVSNSVYLDIPAQPIGEKHDGTLSHNDTKTSIHSQVLIVVGILTAVLVLGIIVLWKKKKIPISCATSETSEHESNLPMEDNPLGNCRVEEGLLQTKQGTDTHVGEIHSSEACPLR